MCTSTVRVPPMFSTPQTLASNWSRVNTLPTLSIREPEELELQPGEVDGAAVGGYLVRGGVERYAADPDGTRCNRRGGVSVSQAQDPLDKLRGGARHGDEVIGIPIEIWIVQLVVGDTAENQWSYVVIRLHGRVCVGGQ